MKMQMQMNSRIKELRIQLKLTQAEFAEKLGATRSAIASLENGNSSVTEQMIKLVCLIYDANESWLRTGKGEMLVKKDDSLEDLFSDASDLEKSIIAAYLSIDADLRDQLIVKFLNSFGKKDLAEKFESGIEQIEKTVKIDKDEVITAKVKKRKQK